MVKLTDQLIDRLASLSFGCSGLGLSLVSAAPALGAAGAAGLAGLLGAGTVMGFAAAAGQKHAVDSEKVLSRIRERLRKDWLLDTELGWAGIADVNAACEVLENSLSQCMLDPKELARVAVDKAGRPFPEAATEIVLELLADQNEIFGNETVSTQFARSVITRAFDAAVEDASYFKRFEPHLLIELARAAGATLGVVEHIESTIERLPEKTARAVVEEMKRQNLTSSLSAETIMLLARMMPTGGDDLDALVKNLMRRLDEVEAQILQAELAPKVELVPLDHPWKRRRGHVRGLSDKGFGFITVDGASDFFFHSNELIDVRFDELREGDRMSCEIVEGPKGPRLIRLCRDLSQTRRRSATPHLTLVPKA